MDDVLTKERINVDGLIVESGTVVSVPGFRVDRLCDAGHAVRSADVIKAIEEVAKVQKRKLTGEELARIEELKSPVDTVRPTWVRLNQDIKRGGGKNPEILRAGSEVELPGLRAERLIAGGKAVPGAPPKGGAVTEKNAVAVEVTVPHEVKGGLGVATPEKEDGKNDSSNSE